MSNETRKKEQLFNLSDELYMAEDKLDGCFNSREFPELRSINQRYDDLISELNEFWVIVTTEMDRTK